MGERGKWIYGLGRVYLGAEFVAGDVGGDVVVDGAEEVVEACAVDFGVAAVAVGEDMADIV